MLVLQGLKSYTLHIVQVTECLCNHKSTILVHMVLNGKGNPSDKGLHGCSLVSVLLLWMS